MQGFLSELRAPYPSLPPITVDGIFGPQTESAVITFQRLFGLTPDGIIGPVTWYAIINERNARV
jgi:peptidoglycan hydrolase-like protein with peptidoglycan-binding domain